ncbi:hypothetical protein PISMIDRAFT_676205 [Pisolithus microcarpus 441]|uniref:Uncharacterized protein n=1 Tax=Pisolithus microcarpus 441 TaxID=765257 RepID=A0A0C9ZVY4_9AGAM|nr:hypothetical protein PISMIDRAFT_676205 [Pisolithus microcarpus 441]
MKPLYTLEVLCSHHCYCCHRDDHPSPDGRPEVALPRFATSEGCPHSKPRCDCYMTDEHIVEGICESARIFLRYLFQQVNVSATLKMSDEQEVRRGETR